MFWQVESRVSHWGSTTSFSQKKQQNKGFKPKIKGVLDDISLYWRNDQQSAKNIHESPCAKKVGYPTKDACKYYSRTVFLSISWIQMFQSNPYILFALKLQYIPESWNIFPSSLVVGKTWTCQLPFVWLVCYFRFWLWQLCFGRWKNTKPSRSWWDFLMLKGRCFCWYFGKQWETKWTACVFFGWVE